ncbi:hypothetical protein EWM64_g2320 [Hericium alpestre]|uniref:Uncharacterized protein n=1 Tax=Hericium alpestre TaxID=135208 RepID=A0A4Z0A700_9AGAM|nr:hypothetical protein EWM64_g2320 [Hericium alpestre]
MLISLVADEATLHLQEMQDSHLDLSSPHATQSSATADAVRQDVRDESEVSPPAGDGDDDDDNNDNNDNKDNNDNVDKDDNVDNDGSSGNAAEEQRPDVDVLSQPTSEDTDTGDERTEGSDSEDDTSEESFQWYANAGGQLYNPKYLQQFCDRLAGRVPQEKESLLDLPLYTQILTGQRVWPNVYFPVICVADSSNIVAHIASVAYQRRVWGIELPVVGLEVSPVGSGVRVHIGWLDSSSNDGRLPVVHTIKPAGIVLGLTAHAAAAQGVFDLANPHSALLFSQFFLALRPHFSGLWDSISAQQLCKLEWRSDYNSATWTANIDEWAKDIDNTDDSSTTESSDEIHPLTPESSFTENQMAPKKEKTVLKGGTLPVDGKPSTRSWVKGWTALEELPSVDPALEDLRRALYDQYCEVSEEPWAQVYADEKHAKIIASRLSLLLACAKGTFTRNSGPVNPLEAEGRHDWDDILSYFYVGAEDEVSSYNMLLERKLRMPRNALLDILNADKTELRDESQSAFLTWSKRDRAVFNNLAEGYEAHAREKDEASAQYRAFHNQCFDALSASVRLSSEYLALLDRPDALHGVVKSQADLEPACGTCDAVLFSALPLDAASVDIRKAYKNFRLVIANPDTSDGPAIPKNAGQKLPHAYLHPLTTHGANRDTAKTRGTRFQQTAPGSRTLISDTHILLPQLIAEYKKVADQETKALNQDRMYLVAAVDFYAAVGIKEYPVFGLAVHGSIGNVIMAWKAENGTIHILERNIRKFDLANPIQAVMFAFFLLRLKDCEEDLKKRFETCQKQLAADLSKGTYKDWAMPETKKTYTKSTETSSRKASKSRKADVPVNASALSRVVEEANETLAGRLGDLHLDAAKPPANPAIDKNPKKN